jgi:hypothetical protein
LLDNAQKLQRMPHCLVHKAAVTHSTKIKLAALTILSLLEQFVVLYLAYLGLLVVCATGMAAD